MSDATNNVLDARLAQALQQYFNGVKYLKTVGDCTIITAIRKQNSAPVDIYSPTFANVNDDTTRAAILADFQKVDKLADPNLQSSERLLNRGEFKQTPSLAMLSCPCPVFDDAFDARPLDYRLRIFEEILKGLAALHEVDVVHGNIHPDAVRREEEASSLKLCDFAWSGGRATTVTEQPPLYQSAHVVNNSQPRTVDDVHAAGMIGYRILMGGYGPQKVLSGRAEQMDDDQVISAILSEKPNAPTGAELFPDGHPAADQIARLLARMTGQLDGSAPYSNASATLRAFRSMVDNPGGSAAVESTSRPAPVRPVTEHSTQPAPQAGPRQGVSNALAIALFAGLLAAGGGAFYMWTQVQDARETAIGLAERIDRANRTVASLSEDINLLLSAERSLGSARAEGGAGASQEAAAAFSVAEATLNGTREDVTARDFEAISEGAERAAGEVAAVASMVANARSAAEDARDRAGAAAEAADRAGYAGGMALAAGQEASDLAQTSYLQRMYQDAATQWAEAEAQFAAALEAASEAAADAEADADAARRDAMARNARDAEDFRVADRFFAEGSDLQSSGDYTDALRRFEDAALWFAAAVQRVEDPNNEIRTITIGSDSDEIAAALRLCLEMSPSGPASCDGTRPVAEQARAATIGPFDIDQTEVSAGAFAAFVEATGHVTEAEQSNRVVVITSNAEVRFIESGYTWSSPRGTNTTYLTNPDLPVINVSMRDAEAYCEWANGRLPTEAEWEHAAQGDADRMFPWGDRFDPELVVWRGAPSPARRLPQAVDAAGSETDAGVFGLSGNAREWVVAEDGGALKGGSWNTTDPGNLRVAARISAAADVPGVDFGFRCARDLEEWP
jgi:sulfatase modifying factor 1